MDIELNQPKTINIGGESFVEVCRVDDIIDKKGRRIQFIGDDDFQLALFKIDGIYYCVDNICPHRHADRIHEGIIKDLTVMCPLHGWTYSLDTGQNVDIRQGIKNLKTYKVEIIENMIYIEKPSFQIPIWRR